MARIYIYIYICKSFNAKLPNRCEKIVKIKKVLALTHLPLILRITLKMWHKILYIDKL